MEVLWDLASVYDDDGEERVASSERIYDAVTTSFTEAGIDVRNGFSFCSDTCNTMFEQNNSVATRFQEMSPNIVINKCKCHIKALCAQAASDELPSNCLELNSSIYNYISKSPKRTKNFYRLQKKRKLKLIFTRWLSHQRCNRRILWRWTVLIEFFRDEMLKGNPNRQVNGRSATHIYINLSAPLNKCY